MTKHSTPMTGPLSPVSFTGAGSELSAALTARLDEVEEFLDIAVTQTDKLPNETSHHLLRAGGKRVRPMLVLLAAEYGDSATRDVVKASAAVELIHLATLYHDDVMDDAPVRRGAQAAHEVWGNSVAILTGDLLFARASLLSAELGVAAVELQSRTFERLVLGQLNEFAGPQPGDDPIEHYLQVLADKTGSLIAGSCEFGLLASGAPVELVPVLRDYGERVGVAFQLADDIIDLTSDSETSGKTPGTDLREGVPTLPVLYLRRAAAAGDAEAQRIVELLAADLSSDEALETARAALAAHPVTAEARAEARRWSDAAVSALDALPAGWIKDSLAEFADTVVSRVA
ncbi:polyprenyl synthetase family protein [Brevibacterium luteolum]|uniref:polyprenyl synthetase family protein n=1 Tax=Brevibacterium luteolum TaxID=199591 RepID=UPI0020B33A96|nr:polyprenyl synthetase family protein [Brevibacterium luteolum]